MRLVLACLLIGCGGSSTSPGDGGGGGDGAPPATPELVAAGDYCGFALDGDTIYLAGKAEASADSTELYRVSRSGGAAPELLGGAGHAAACPLVVDGGFVYYQGGITADDPAISRLAPSGTPQIVVVGGFGSTTAGVKNMALAGGWLWYTRTTTIGRLLRVDLTGFDGTAPANAIETDTGDNQTSFVGVAIADGRVFYGKYGGTTQIRSRTVDNSAVVDIPADSQYASLYPDDLVATPGTVYVAGADVYAVPVAGPPATRLSFSGRINTHTLALDGDMLYLGGRGTQQTPTNRLGRVAITGGDPEILVEDIAVTALAVDATAIYWIDPAPERQGIWRMAKPE